MEHISKTATYLLDAASGTTLIGAIISGHTLLMILGGLASIAAILNHGYQFIQRIKKNKKAKNVESNK